MRAHIGPGQSADSIVVKFVDAAHVRLRKGRFVARSDAQVASVNATAERYDAAPRRLFARSESSLAADELRAEGHVERDLADPNSYFVLDVPDSRTGARVLEEVLAEPIVETAHARAIAVAPPARDFSHRQAYKSASPIGIDSDAAAARAGGRHGCRPRIRLEPQARGSQQAPCSRRRHSER
jgi:hypothetical protein